MVPFLTLLKGREEAFRRVLFCLRKSCGGFVFPRRLVIKAIVLPPPKRLLSTLHGVGGNRLDKNNGFGDELARVTNVHTPKYGCQAEKIIL